MNIITLEHISKVFTERKVFDETDFYLQEGEKVGIVGINGTGKSTLLKIIAEKEEVDAGKVITASNLVIRYLPQHPEFEPHHKVLEAVVGTCPESERMDRETQAKVMLTKLGFVDWEQEAGNLSGGQRKRLALVSVLLSGADVLLLDEPTNHLDYEMTEWLQNYLQGYRGTILMVTHDRYFLDSVCNRIVELDKGKIYSYQENYSGFLERKAEREEMAFASDRKRKSLLRTELEWVQRGARARSTKQKFRLNRYEELKNTRSPEKDGKVEMGSVVSRMGKTTVELHDICKSYGDKQIIKDFTYIFLKNDRIGIIGPNGCGKTTLMKIIAGRLEQDAGERVVGATIKIGYYSQMIEDAQAKMDPDQRLIDYIKEAAEYVQTTDGMISASQMLEKFLFLRSAQYSTLGKLSGGEKRRLNLLRVLMEAPNVLILDEPTNDLDITTLGILEDYLDHFQGIVIMVSHDRFFLDRTVGRIFAFQPDGTLKQYEGAYTDYLLRKMEEDPDLLSGIQSLGGKPAKSAEEKQSSKEDWKKQNAANRKLKFTYQEQRDYEHIEEEIAELEDRLEHLDEQMGLCVSDFVRLNELTKEKEEIRNALDEKMQRWMYLEELAEKIKELG